MASRCVIQENHWRSQWHPADRRYIDMLFRRDIMRVVYYHPHYRFGGANMKSATESFDFGTLIMVFLPGLALATGIRLIMYGDPNEQSTWDLALSVLGKTDEWQETFAAVAFISLLGSVIAAFNGLLESCFYDRITRICVHLTRNQYDTQWQEYLYRLSKENNSYIDRIATWFRS